MINLAATTLILLAAFCQGHFTAAGPNAYEWSNVTQAANFPKGYNYPVFVHGNWMVALNDGMWLSNDGERWIRTELPASGLNAAYQKYLSFNGAIYALGSMSGNYENFTIDTTIRRTRDFREWETVSKNTNLPKRIFYGTAVFEGKMWMFGGYDGKRYHNDVWNSTDGIFWERVTEHAAWSPRTISTIAVFQNNLWLFGGSVIDGDAVTHPNAPKQLWSSANGKDWTLVKTNLDKKWGGTPVVYDNKLWLIGMNRGAAFASAVWHSEDGARWKEDAAPWSPRGAVAAWVYNDRLFMTGGKSSHTENGQIKFVYSNDVWTMSKTNGEDR